MQHEKLFSDLTEFLTAAAIQCRASLKEEGHPLQPVMDDAVFAVSQIEDLKTFVEANQDYQIYTVVCQDEAEVIIPEIDIRRSEGYLLGKGVQEKLVYKN